MLAYCIRQLIRGVTNLLLASFLIFTVLTYAPFGAQAQLDKYVAAAAERGTSQVEYYMHIDFEHTRARWPQSYLLWLFDPHDTQDFSTDCYCFVTRGLNFEIGTLHLAGSGIVTGHWGASTHLAPGQPVLSEFLLGRGSLVLSGAMVLLILISMFVAAFQRRHRLKPLSSHNGPESYLIAPHYFMLPTPLVGWYRRTSLAGAPPQFRLY
jgi:hypothetical protein